MTTQTLNIDKLEILSKSSLFHQLPSNELKQLASFATLKRVAAKEIVFHKSDVNNQMFAIVSSCLKS